jgi:hypothetical protein
MFTHSFKADLRKIRFTGNPYAFIRLGDGERAICMGVAITPRTELWHYHGGDTAVSAAIKELVYKHEPGIKLGISCSCCDRKAAIWYRKNVATPAKDITFANLFVNSNYREFMSMIDRLGRNNYTLVACKSADITVPENALTDDYDPAETVKEMLLSTKPILVAAGPVKCKLILDYWRLAKNKQIVVDIGSTLDPIIHGKETRRYHSPDSPTASRVCTWLNPADYRLFGTNRLVMAARLRWENSRTVRRYPAGSKISTRQSP